MGIGSGSHGVEGRREQTVEACNLVIGEWEKAEQAEGALRVYEEM